MRRVLWRRRFEELSADDLLILVAHVLEGVAVGRVPHRVALQALLSHLETQRGVDYPPRRDLYEAAKCAGNAAVTQLLLSTPPAKLAHPDQIRPPVLDRERDVTLGERRSLARSPDRDLIDRLLFDPDPGVMQNLLANPRLTEQDVMRIASRRPSQPEVLVSIAHHERWGKRAPLVRAIAQNPYASVSLVVGLVAMLDRPVLAEMARDSSLSPVVRARARAQMKLRSPGRLRPDASELVAQRDAPELD